jgi:hypothetical protein
LWLRPPPPSEACTRPQPLPPPRVSGVKRWCPRKTLLSQTPPPWPRLCPL